MKFNALVLITIFQILLGSCATSRGDQRPEGSIIERSKQAKPVWADLPNEQLIVNATEAKIHYFLAKQRDLPIAIKLAQSNAIENSYTSWKPSFEARLSEFPSILTAKNSRNEKEYSEQLEQVSRKVHTQVAQIEDIYYEKIRIEHPEKVPELDGVSEFYDVHILIQLLPVDSLRIKTVLYQVFQSSRSIELRNAVKEFNPKPSKLIKPSKKISK